MSEFSEPLERLFAAESSPQQVREIEAGANAMPLWNKIAETEFHNALVAESKGGVGLPLAEVFDVLLACGANSLPLPLPLTMLARAELAAAGSEPPEGPMTVATIVKASGGSIVCERVPYALTSQWLLAVMPDGCALLPVAEGKLTRNNIHGSFEGKLEFDVKLAKPIKLTAGFDWQAACAAVTAAQMAGAMERVLTDTIRYANERSQFGKPIGKFQAIQHEISVMAEHAFAARMAAQLGCASRDHRPLANLAAVAKARASEAVMPIVAFAHAVHGAMGITEEYNLQLCTRRLHEWRLDYGSESYWNRQVGERMLGSRQGSAEYIRAQLSAS